MPGKLLAIVRRQAAALQPIEQTDQGNLNSSRSLVLYLCCQQQASLSVNHGNQAPCPRLTPAPQMFPCFKGQARGLHGPVDGGDGYCKGFPAPDLLRRPAILEPGLEKGLQCFILQLEGQLTALAAQTIELVCLVGTL